MILEKLNSLKPWKTLAIRRRGFASGLSEMISGIFVMFIMLILNLMKVNVMQRSILIPAFLGAGLLGNAILILWVRWGGNEGTSK